MSTTGSNKAPPQRKWPSSFLAPLQKLLDLLFELLDALAQRSVLRLQPGDFRFQLGDPSISIIHDPVNVTENPISGKRKCLTVTSARLAAANLALTEYMETELFRDAAGHVPVTVVWGAFKRWLPEGERALWTRGRIITELVRHQVLICG